MSQPRVVLLGPPGAGKGTQGAALATEFDVPHVTTGDALRANKDMDISDLDAEYDTPRGYMEAGELVPDSVVTAIVEEALADADGFVLDGYPRNVAQAEALDDMTDLDVVILLEVPEAELVHRLSGRRIDPETDEVYHVEYDPPEDPAVERRLVQRDDDTEETVRERLRVYREETEPVADFYGGRGALERVDGDDAPNVVTERVSRAVEAARSA